MKKWLKYLIIGLGVLVLVLFIGLLFVTRGQASELVNNPMEERREMVETPSDYDLAYEDVTTVNASGIELAGWFVPGENDAVIMMHHGYKGDRQSLLEEAQLLHPLGYNILFTSMCAHDKNEGEMIYFGQVEMEDLEAWYQHLLNRDDIDPDKIGLLGNSLGGTMAIQFAAQNESIKAVVVHTPFSSLEDTVTTSVGHFLDVPDWVAVIIAPFITFWAEQDLGFDVAEVDATLWAGDIAPRPLLVLQAEKDEVVSAEGGKAIYEAAREPKELWVCELCDHTEFEKRMPAQFTRRVGDFFERNLSG